MNDFVLEKRLSVLADRGFIETNGCFFLKESFVETTNAQRNDFPDDTGYECFMNHIHIDNFVETGMLFQAILFIEEVFSVWSRAYKDKILNALMGCCGELVTVRFHLRRRENICSRLN